MFGPFHRQNAPEMPWGGNIAHLDKKGAPTLVSGRVLDLDGRPIAGALLDVWQAQTSGLYDSQDPNLHELHMRGKFHTDAEGRYLVRTVLPVNYPIPSDGPVGAMLRATGRHPWRPAHIHFVVSAEGYEPVTTHIFDRTDEYLGSDAVFAVKDSLICDFVRHDSPERGGPAARHRPALLHHPVRFPPEAGGRGRPGHARRPAPARRPGRCRGIIHHPCEAAFIPTRLRRDSAMEE